MSEPFLGAIKMLPYRRIPARYAYCNGQTVPISSHQQLFTLLGTTYGGNGFVDFKLPDLQGRVPIHRNVNDQSSVYPAPIGTPMGSNDITLTEDNLPEHTHSMYVCTDAPNQPKPEKNFFGKIEVYTKDNSFRRDELHPLTISQVYGNGSPHNNLMPSLGINFCIALTGIYPLRP